MYEISIELRKCSKTVSKRNPTTEYLVKLT